MPFTIDKDRVDMFKIEPLSETETLEAIKISIPKHLKPIVANAPKDDEAIGKYISDLVADDKITDDDVDFLIDSGALI